MVTREDDGPAISYQKRPLHQCRTGCAEPEKHPLQSLDPSDHVTQRPDTKCCQVLIGTVNHPRGHSQSIYAATTSSPIHVGHVLLASTRLPHVEQCHSSEVCPVVAARHGVHYALQQARYPLWFACT